MNHTLQQEVSTLAQARETLTLAAKLYFSTDELGLPRVSRRRARPICLMGPAGIGKTELVHQVAQELDLALCCYSIPHHTRQSLLGLPKLETREIDGQQVACTRYTMSEIIDEVHRTIESTGKRQGILFLDEFNCANESVRPVMLQLLQDKSFGTHPIPEGWMLVLAGNPSKYNKSAKDLDSVTLDRLRMVHIEPNLDDWMVYARNQGVHPAILNYLTQNPKDFYCYDEANALVTPRGWEDLSIQLKLLEEEGIQPDLTFLAQFLHAPQIIRGLLQSYFQYSDLIESGLVSQIFTKSPLCLPTIQAMSTAQRWDLVAVLLSDIHTKASHAAAFNRAVAQTHEILSSHKAALQKGDDAARSLLRKQALDATDPLCRNFLLGCAPLITQEQGWNSVKGAFEIQLCQPQKTYYSQVVQQVEHTIAVCNRAMDDAPSVERLFNGLCDHLDTASILSTANTPQFQSLFHSIHADPTSAYESLAQKLEACS